MKKTTLRQWKKDLEQIRIGVTVIAGYMLFLMGGLFLGIACTMGKVWTYLPDNLKFHFGLDMIVSAFLIPIAWFFFLFLGAIGNTRWYKRVIKEEAQET